MNVKIARTLDDFDFTLLKEPLNEDNYDDYYVVTEKGRGEDPISGLIKSLQKMKTANRKILVAGFGGCGKSTELFRLKRKLDDDFMVRIFSVMKELDPNNLTISEILITVMKDLIEFVHENYKDLRLSDDLIKNLENWTKTIYTEEIKYKYFEKEFKAGLNLEVGFGKILNIFTKLGLDFNAGRKFQEITKKEIEQTLTELIINCNLLVDEIKSQLYKINKQNIIFVIEDLEKVALKVAMDLFFNYSKQLTGISCCFIYTFPISLVFNQKYNVIINNFDENIVLPMIKTHDKQGRDYEPGIQDIRDIIFRRVDKEKDLFAPGLLDKFIRMSGGCLKDLFRMLLLAAGNAVEKNRSQIQQPDFEYSLNRLKNNYYNTISYNEETGMTTEDYYEILIECCNSTDKRPEDRKGLMDLKHNLCILGYNGEQWYDVHPVVKELLRDKKKIQ